MNHCERIYVTEQFYITDVQDKVLPGKPALSQLFNFLLDLSHSFMI